MKHLLQRVPRPLFPFAASALALLVIVPAITLALNDPNKLTVGSSHTMPVSNGEVGSLVGENNRLELAYDSGIVGTNNGVTGEDYWGDGSDLTYTTNSFAIGQDNRIGSWTDVESYADGGTYAVDSGFVAGRYNMLWGGGSVSLLGRGLINTHSTHAVIVGRYNFDDGDSLWNDMSYSGLFSDARFIVGNGADNNNRSNALVVYGNGDVHLPNTGPSNPGVLRVWPAGDLAMDAAYQTGTKPDEAP